MSIYIDINVDFLLDWDNSFRFYTAMNSHDLDLVSR